MAYSGGFAGRADTRQNRSGYSSGPGKQVSTGGTQGGGGYDGAVGSGVSASQSSQTSSGTREGTTGGLTPPPSSGDEASQRPALSEEEQQAKDYLARFEDNDNLINPAEAFEGDQGASKVLGRLNRAQWEDWKKRFRPAIDELADYANDWRAPNQAGYEASEAMGKAVNDSYDANQQRHDSLGIPMPEDQARANDRRRNIGTTAAQISAGNQARMAERDRQNKIMAGGMGLSNIPDKVMEQ